MGTYLVFRVCLSIDQRRKEYGLSGGMMTNLVGKSHLNPCRDHLWGAKGLIPAYGQCSSKYFLHIKSNIFELHPFRSMPCSLKSTYKQKILTHSYRYVINNQTVTDSRCGVESRVSKLCSSAQRSLLLMQHTMWEVILIWVSSAIRILQWGCTEGPPDR